MPIRSSYPPVNGVSSGTTRSRSVVGRDARSGCPVSPLRDEHARLRKIAGRWLVESLGDWPIQAGVARPPGSPG